MWVWMADTSAQEQVSVYTSRCVTIESSGPTWLWGTASEHSVMYQYNVVGAQGLFMGMIQTKSPYFQPVPLAPNPFTAGTFRGDPLCGSSLVWNKVSRIDSLTSNKEIGRWMRSTQTNITGHCGRINVV
ncbi:Peptidoglycan-binding Lysin subgroup [Penicillium antarcticum]|uniref:Peptidoglycan-binding Lysin subgroup n=1 Tax=Penicillium antarcticum TaxID=416450 RepID=UPI00238F750D|nr:Peptidoglycan-binding Lysin subgroup [Penicillium antarcticum]KAJ5312567.1 Peptidoglycan-binding Lysin subgroup [Penicillium antarcticum]